MPRVFISYSHDSREHGERVLRLAEQLREDGLDTYIDQHVNGTPEEGWPRWMQNQLELADFVLVVCTETSYTRYRGHEVGDKGKGASWEGAIIYQALYDAKSTTTKFVPVVFEPQDTRFIPEPLRGFTHYRPTSEVEYTALYAFLRGVGGVEPGALGELRPVSRRRIKPSIFDTDNQLIGEVDFHHETMDPTTTGPRYRHHVYLVYDAVDRELAEALYSRLSSQLDVVYERGQAPESVLRRNQEASFLTVAIVSPHTPPEFFRRHDVARAIVATRQRSPQHKLVALLAPRFHRTKLPLSMTGIDCIEPDEDDIEPYAHTATYRIVRSANLQMARLGHRHHKPSPSAEFSRFRSEVSTRRLMSGHKTNTPEIQPWMDFTVPPVDLELFRTLESEVGDQEGWYLVYIDIDRLSGINKRFGSLVGDAVVRRVAEIIRHELSSMVRCGRDEFVSYELVGTKGPREIEEGAFRALAQIQSFDWNQLAPGLFVSACAGWAAREADEEISDWAIRAVLGCLDAKRSGISRVSAGPLAVPRGTSRNLWDHQSE